MLYSANCNSTCFKVQHQVGGTPIIVALLLSKMLQEMISVRHTNTKIGIRVFGKPTKSINIKNFMFLAYDS